MSEEMPTTRDGIADAITADLTARDTMETSPAPEVAAAPEITFAPTPPAETPAPATGAVPATPFKLTDTSLVEDPATGEMVEWGKIKADRLRQADYTKKTMALAEERRQYEAAESRRQAAFEAYKAQQVSAALPELPEDDPYAQRIRAIEAQAKYLAEVDAQRQQAYEAQMQQAQAQESRVALEAAEKKLAADFGFDQREIELVEAEYYRRGMTGETPALDQIAKEYKAYLTAKEEAAVSRFKEKHRVSAPASGVSVPAAGVTDSTPVPGSRGFLDAIREEVGALMR